MPYHYPGQPTPAGRRWYPGVCYGPDDGYSREEALASVGAGWSDLVGRAWDAVTDAGGRVSQVKEKFGSLRLYHSLVGPFRIDVHPPVVGAGSYQIGPSTELSALLNEIEAASLRTCERCGAAGEQTATHWVKALCAEHAASWSTGDTQWDPAVSWDWRA